MIKYSNEERKIKRKRKRGEERERERGNKAYKYIWKEFSFIQSKVGFEETRLEM